MDNNFHALILAGGIGVRLWPKSRVNRPKQFLKLGGEMTLLSKTTKRAKAIFKGENIWIFCKPYQRQEIERQLPDIPKENIIIEPAPKGTAAAIIYGSLLIRERDPDAVVSVFPSDHSIRPLDKFARSIMAGMNWAAENRAIVIYGIRPDRPETAYGYIEAGGTVGQCLGWQCMEVTSFHEKPDRQTARAYFDSKRFLWNSGMLSFSSQVLKELLEELGFDVWFPLLGISPRQDKDALEPITRQVYESLPADPFDTAILEKLARYKAGLDSGQSPTLVVFPCDFEWHDLGVWESYYRLAPKDDAGNAIIGTALGLDCQGSLILSEGKTLVAAVGVEDMVIVCEDDAVLVCPRQQLDRMKELVDSLRKKGYEKYV